MQDITSLSGELALFRLLVEVMISVRYGRVIYDLRRVKLRRAPLFKNADRVEGNVLKGEEGIVSEGRETRGVSVLLEMISR